MLRYIMALFVCLAGTAHADGNATSRIAINVTKRGFEPDPIKVAANTPLVLVFTRTTDATCAKAIMLTLPDGKKLERELPLNKAVELPVTFAKPGSLTYACSMDMAKGTIVVQ